MQHRLEEAVVKETVNQMSQNSLVVLIGNMVASLVIGFYFWWITELNFFTGWMVGMALVTCLRFWLVSFTLNANPEK